MQINVLKIFSSELYENRFLVQMFLIEIFEK